MREEVAGNVHKIYKPKNDSEFLEQVSFITFVIGFNFNVVRNKWPTIKKAFHNFSIEKVAAMNEKDIQKLLQNSGVIRNRRKLTTVIDNARICKELCVDNGTVLKWIDAKKKAHKKDPLLNPSLAEEFRIFSGIGKTTSGWLDNLHNAKGQYIEYERE